MRGAQGRASLLDRSRLSGNDEITRMVLTTKLQTLSSRLDKLQACMMAGHSCCGWVLTPGTHARWCTEWTGMASLRCQVASTARALARMIRNCAWLRAGNMKQATAL
jgi:hypothetical protein